MIHELNHIGIKTCDVEASIGFYRNILGGTIVRDAKSTDGKSRFVYIQLAIGIVELITINDPKDQGFAHIAFLVDNLGLDAAYEMLCNHGIEFTVRPKVAGSGDGRLAFFRDPCGVIFELIEREARPRATLSTNNKVLAFDHTTIGAGDKATVCETFYSGDMDLTALGASRYAKCDDTLLVTDEVGGILNIALKTASTNALRTEMRGHGIATRDEEGGFIAFAPSGERIFFFE